MKSKKSVVLISGILFNLSIGVLYSWSVVKSALKSDLHWTANESVLPYTLAIVFFALGLLFGGKAQDKIGPKKVITVGGILVGLGLIVSSFLLNTPSLVAISFGVITGTGIGFGYGCVSPVCLKWFHPSQKGLISGLVVGAFGLGAVIISPVSKALLSSVGVEKTFLYLGIVIMIICFIVSRFIVNPEPGYVPEEPKIREYKNAKKTNNVIDYTSNEMLKTKQFYLIILIFAFGSSVGLMVIGNMADIFNSQVGLDAAITATVMVSLLSIFNAGGRVIAGILSDKIGRVNTLIITAVIQTVAMLFFPSVDSLTKIIIGGILVGYTYGSYLSVMPAYAADNYGLKNYGNNYGIIYLGWGVAGILAPMLAANIGISNAYYVCAGFSVFVLILCLALKKIGNVQEQ